MIELTRQNVLFLCICLGLGLSTQAYPPNDSNRTSLDSISQSLRYHYPDSSLQLLDQAFDEFLRQGDTLHAINTLFISSNINGNMANYKDAYDRLWKGLSLADDAKLEREKAQFYIEIGRYYSFYKRGEKALEYFQVSLDMNRKLLGEGKIDRAELVDNYYAFCSTYRELDNSTLAKKYLDSCFMYFEQGKSPVEKPFLQFEQACIQSASGMDLEAIQTFEEVQKWFETYATSYLVLFYTYKSDVLQRLDRLSESEAYYKKALDISDRYHMHIDFSPLIHEKLADLYLKKGDYKQAFNSMEKVKELDARFFDSRSATNRSLLEIQDAFRLEQKAQQELIQQQKLERLEHEEDVWFLQRVILLVSIFFILSISYLFFSYIRAKHKAEKQMLEKEKKLELQKAQEVLEIKNKELAASALKLIEKDENLSLLKNKINETNGNVNVHELKQVLRSISISNDRNWKEFETRFVAVNESFYQRLQEKFPKLTQRDLKLCALIKLNFSSKEMAKLLGISIESAHTSRYRLRKKLNLSRETNLTEFIANQ